MTKTQQPPATGQPSRNGGPAWALAAFVVILALGGLYLAFSGDDGQVVDQLPTPTTVLTPAPNPTRLTQEDYEPIEPGYYFVDSDGDLSTTAGASVIIESQGWIGSNEGVNFNSENGVSLHLHPVVEPFTPGCDRTVGAPLAAGSTAADLADGFAASGFTVREAPAPVSAFGHDGYHVVVEVPEGCEFGGDPGGTHIGGLTHIFLNEGDVIEAWIFDMEGQVAMVEALWLLPSPGITESQEEEVAELRAVIDTLVLTP